MEPMLFERKQDAIQYAFTCKLRNQNWKEAITYLDNGADLFEDSASFAPVLFLPTDLSIPQNQKAVINILVAYAKRKLKESIIVSSFVATVFKPYADHNRAILDLLTSYIVAKTPEQVFESVFYEYGQRAETQSNKPLFLDQLEVIASFAARFPTFMYTGHLDLWSRLYNDKLLWNFEVLRYESECFATSINIGRSVLHDPKTAHTMIPSFLIQFPYLWKMLDFLSCQVDRVEDPKQTYQYKLSILLDFLCGILALSSDEQLFQSFRDSNRLPDIRPLPRILSYFIRSCKCIVKNAKTRKNIVLRTIKLLKLWQILATVSESEVNLFYSIVEYMNPQNKLWKQSEDRVFVKDCYLALLSCLEVNLQLCPRRQMHALILKGHPFLFVYSTQNESVPTTRLYKFFAVILRKMPGFLEHFLFDDSFRFIRGCLSSESNLCTKMELNPLILLCTMMNVEMETSHLPDFFLQSVPRSKLWMWIFEAYTFVTKPQTPTDAKLYHLCVSFLCGVFRCCSDQKIDSFLVQYGYKIRGVLQKRQRALPPEPEVSFHYLSSSMLTAFLDQISLLHVS